MNSPSIPEQIACLETQIRTLRESNEDEAGQIEDAQVAREIECMRATVALLKRWSA